MYRRGRSPPRGYGEPMGRRRSPPPDVRRRLSPPRFLGPPPPGDLRGPPPPFDRRSPPRGGGPPPSQAPRDDLIPSVRVTFKNPLQRPEDDPNNIPIQPRHPPARTSVVVVPARVPTGGRAAGGRSPPARQRSRSPPRRRAASPPRGRSPPRRISPLPRRMSPPPPRRGVSPPPPFMDRLPPPGMRGRSPPPPLRGMPPPGYDRRRSPSPPPFARGPPPLDMMGPPPGMRGPPGRPLSPPRRPLSPPRRALSPPRMGRPLSPPRRALSPPRRPLSPPRMGRPLSPPRMGRPLSPPRMGRPLSPPRRRSPPGMMMGPRPARGFPPLDARGPPPGPGPRGSFPEPMDFMPSSRGGPPMLDDRRGPPGSGPVPNGRGVGGPALGPSPASTRSGRGGSPRGGGSGPRTSTVPQQRQAPSARPGAAAAVDAEVMRKMPTANLEKRSLERLAAEPTANSFFYIDPQGDIQGPHSVTQFREWMKFLKNATADQHRLAYEQFCSVSVWRQGMHARVPLLDLLAAAPE